MFGTVTTNHHTLELESFFDLSEAEMAEFKSLELSPNNDEAFEPRFFRYAGAVHDTHDFVRIEAAELPSAPFSHVASVGDPLRDWHAIATSSSFEGIVFRYADDFEHVVAGTWRSA